MVSCYDDAEEGRSNDPRVDGVTDQSKDDLERRTIEAVRLQRLRARSRGQLEGEGLWLLREDGGGTHVTYYWRVTPATRWMRWLTRSRLRRTADGASSSRSSPIYSIRSAMPRKGERRSCEAT